MWVFSVQTDNAELMLAFPVLIDSFEIDLTPTTLGASTSNKPENWFLMQKQASKGGGGWLWHIRGLFSFISFLTTVKKESHVYV